MRGTDAMTTETPPARGEELLPGYLAVERLALGRRLETWDAFDLDRRTRCVVKMLRADRLDEAEVAASVLQEGRIVTSLRHPHLVRGYEVVTEPRPAMVLETLRGATLAALLDEGPLPLADVAHLGLQLCSVLAYLHQHEWLHLDVKAENVIAAQGSAVLIDLSLAGRPGSGRPGAGTDGYLAPEQASGAGLSTATDVWGLGVTLIESLTGELPYGDHQDWERPRTPFGRRRRPRPRLPNRVPPGVHDLLGSCVELDAGGRPSLADLAQVLLEYAGPGAFDPFPDRAQFTR